jgi:hypothetical protein
MIDDQERELASLASTITAALAMRSVGGRRPARLHRMSLSVVPQGHQLDVGFW